MKRRTVCCKHPRRVYVTVSYARFGLSEISKTFNQAPFRHHAFALAADPPFCCYVAARVGYVEMLTFNLLPQQLSNTDVSLQALE